jgi:DHA1 family tetracycline resistance protein-like MFS transporter
MAAEVPLNYASPDAPLQPPKGSLAAIFLIVLSDFLGFGLIIPALPFYVLKFGVSPFQIGVIGATYSACQLVATPLLGAASDRYGRRPILLLSQIGSVLGYVLLAVAVGYHWEPAWVGLVLLYVARAIDGFSGGNVSTAQAYVSDVTTPENRARGMGLIGAAFGIGFSIGPGIGGVLGWIHDALPAVAAAVACSAAVLMTWLRLKEPMRHRKDAETEAWLHPSRFTPILRNPLVAQLLAISFFSMIGFVMIETVFAIYMKDRFGFEMLGSGIFFLWFGIVIAVVQGKLIGRLVQRFGEWRLAIVGPLLIAAAMFFYGSISWIVLPMALGVVTVLFAGLLNAGGRSTSTPTISSLISRGTDDRLQGAVFGLFHMLGSLARVIGPLIAAALYIKHPTWPFMLCAGIMLLMAAWTIVLRANQRPAVAPAAA